MMKRTQELEKLSVMQLIAESAMKSFLEIEKQKDLVTQKSMLSVLNQWIEDVQKSVLQKPSNLSLIQSGMSSRDTITFLNDDTYSRETSISPSRTQV